MTTSERYLTTVSVSTYPIDEVRHLDNKVPRVPQAYKLPRYYVRGRQFIHASYLWNSSFRDLGGNEYDPGMSYLQQGSGIIARPVHGTDDIDQVDKVLELNN